mmetsp:Transcript_21140/g.46106  ORF Transcript_21140/g.46106 Transcript_21140/m.46106 type:complete len:108 (-) Transcript_21140:819-1142(-)
MYVLASRGVDLSRERGQRGEKESVEKRKRAHGSTDLRSLLRTGTRVVLNIMVGFLRRRARVELPVICYGRKGASISRHNFFTPSDQSQTPFVSLSGTAVHQQNIRGS